jgi:hypothetical protein
MLVHHYIAEYALSKHHAMFSESGVALALHGGLTISILSPATLVVLIFGALQCRTQVR